MRRLLGLLAVAATLLAQAGAPATAEALAGLTYAHAADVATNKVRAQHGLVALDHSDCIAHLAWAQAHRMARQHRVFHQDMGVVLRTCHLSYAAENAAAGFRTGASVVYDGWMKSAPHRANILSTHYRLMVVGAVRSDNGRWYVSQVFGRRA
ncbi:MAG TPA: CAP domain-containing protein [Nocardioides sp.]|nr:CAP domain-containing protein [Nocardioides sp.]